MKLKQNSMKRSIVVQALVILSLSWLASNAVADERYPMIKNQLVIDECGACHMAFQPQLLPARSWQAIMNDLPNHFGEDARLDSNEQKQIEAYLVNNSGDQTWYGSRILRGLSQSKTPLRISELPYWIKEHDEEVSQREWKSTRVGSKANCLACHKLAEKGNYDDD